MFIAAKNQFYRKHLVAIIHLVVSSPLREGNHIGKVRRADPAWRVGRPWGNGLRAGWGRLKGLLVGGALVWLAHGAVPAALAVQVAGDPQKQKPVFQWIFTLVMVGLVCAVAFKNPKRSHQS